MDVAILGATPVGSRFARAAAEAGFTVSIHARDANAVLDTIDSVGAAGAGDRIDGTTDLASAVAGADRVIDCYSDDADATRERLAAVESHLETLSFLATVTETRPVGTVAVGLRDPQRLVGFHPFAGHVDHPPPETAPVEVIRTDSAGDGTVDSATGFLEALQMTPLVVGDGPGFVAGRLALALQAEAMRTVEEGVTDAATVDRVRQFQGDEMGPLERSDRQGLDAVQDALEAVAAVAGERFDHPEILERKVAAGHRGRDSGTGFYEWEAGSVTGPADDV